MKIKSPFQMRMFLKKMNKLELKEFLRKNKIPIYISPYSTKAGWIEEALSYIFGINSYKVSPKRKRFNKALLKQEGKRVGRSIFGHREDGVRGYMDRRLHEGASIEKLSNELMEEFDMIKNYTSAFRRVMNHLFYLPPARGITVIIILRPDPNRNEIKLVFDDGLRGKKKRKSRKYDIVEK